MNISSMIEIQAYGIPGRSGCHGPNCGRRPTGKAREEFQNITREINDGGVTYDLLKHRNIGSGNAVSIYPDRSKVFNGKITPLDISKFAQENSTLLSQPGHALGGWYDSGSGKIYLDVSAVVPNQQKAIDLGRKYNQKAVFDLNKFQEIPTGGTGENISVPPIKQRIREARLAMAASAGQKIALHNLIEALLHIEKCGTQQELQKALSNKQKLNELADRINALHQANVKRSSLE